MPENLPSLLEVSFYASVIPRRNVENMRKIKIVKDKVASQTKHALDIGDVPPVVLENFETLTQPPFKPRLELIEADPHNPPDMNTNTDQNIKTDGEDSNRPSAEDITRKSPEYQNAPKVEKEKIPHENEHVKQGAAEEDNRPDFLKEKDEENSEEEADKQVEAIQKLKTEYAQRYNLASQLFDIKLTAGIEQEINRHNFIAVEAEASDIPTLENRVKEARLFLGQMNVQPKEASVRIPANVNFETPAREVRESPFGDDLLTVVMGGELDS
jgi:hypothetical protein